MHAHADNTKQINAYTNRCVCKYSLPTIHRNYVTNEHRYLLSLIDLVQNTKNLDVSVLCRCVRVVKEMDLKPIVISRAGSNPVADVRVFFCGCLLTKKKM